MEDPVPIIIIAGPTACGKTRMAIQVALKINGEIVSADSRQIYQLIDIGTAKPTLKERETVPHHLVDFVPLDMDYSVADYVADASRIIQEIKSRNHEPIVCGGTGLYIRKLLHGLFEVPGRDERLRAELEKRFEADGLASLYEFLSQVDTRAAAGIHPNDKFRILRALEVFLSTRTPISELRATKTKPLLPLDPLFYILTKSRPRLYEDIRMRVDRMVEMGLVEEVEKIKEMRYDFSMKSLSGLGYGEIQKALDKRISMKRALENIKTNTCRYAKRQLTWFRKDKITGWFYVDSAQQFETAYNTIVNDWIKKNENKHQSR